MAWEELLKQHEDQNSGVPVPVKAEDRPQGSLIQQVGRAMGKTGWEMAEPASEEAAYLEPVRLPDGYVRSSPVQVYVTPPDYHRRKIRKLILGAVALVFLALVAVALVRSGLMKIR